MSNPTKFGTSGNDGGLQILVGTQTIGSEDIRSYIKDTDGDILLSSGTAAVTNATSGYAKGALHIDTDVGAGTSGLYQNIGTNTSSNFDLFSPGGSTTYNAIGDPTGSGSIQFAANTGTYTSTTANWGGLIMSNTHVNPTAGASLINLDYTADGDASGVFIDCTDNAGADSKFLVGLDGATVITGSATGTAALTLTAGDLTMTAGDIDIAADNRKLSLGAAGDTDSYILFDGGGNLTFFDSTVGVEKTLTELLGSGLTNPVVTGDLTITDGKFDWTDGDDEVAATWTFNGAANNDITWSSSITTANALALTANAATSGSLVYLETSAAGFTGEYLRCYDGAADDFSVGVAGLTTIAGAAAGTDALVVTAGDLFLSDTDGTIIESEDGTATMVLLDNKAGVIASDSAVLEVNAGGAVASGGNLLRVVPSGSPNAGAIGIEYVGAAKAMQAMFIDGDPTGAHLVSLNGGGALTDQFAVLGVANDGNLAAGGCDVLVTMGGTPDTDGRALEIDAQKDARALYIDTDALANHACEITHSGNLATAKSVLHVTDAGIPAADDTAVVTAQFTGTATNESRLFSADGDGKDVVGLYIDTDNTLAQNSGSIVLFSDAAAAQGPSLVVDHDSASPAADDQIFGIHAWGEDSGGGEQQYGRITMEVLVPTAASEEGQIKMAVDDGGTLRESFWLTDDTLALGDAAAFVLGSNGGQDLSISTAITTAGLAANEPKIVMTDGAAGNITVTAGGTSGEVDMASPVLHSSTETITAGTGGALALTTSVSLLETDGGGDAYTLAAGAVGQIKFITMVTNGGGTGVVTLTGNPAGYDVVTFTNVGESGLFIYTATGWLPISLQGATIA